MLEAFGMCCGLEQDQHIESALALSRANLDALKTKGGLVVPGSQVRREGGPFSRPKVQCLIACVGVGGALRSPLSHLTDLALGRGGSPAWGVLGVGVGDDDARLCDALRDQDMLYTVVSRGAQSGARVVEAVVNSVHMAEDPEAAMRACSNARVRILALALGGSAEAYELREAQGLKAEVASDVGTWKTGPGEDVGLDAPKSAAGLCVAVLARRRARGLGALSFMSSDDVPRNGEKCRHLVLGFAQLVDPSGDLARWIAARCTFPSCVLDRISAPSASEDVDRLADDFGVADACPVVAEDYLLFVCEDDFALGRPNWDLSGGGASLLVDDTRPYEVSRLRLLDGAKIAAAFLGLLRGYRVAHRAFGDSAVRRAVDAFLDFVAPTLPTTPGLDLDAYRATLLMRLANPELRSPLSAYAENASARLSRCLGAGLAALPSTARLPPSVALVLAAVLRAFVDARDELDASFPLYDDRGDALHAAATAVAEGYRDRDVALPKVSAFLLVAFEGDEALASWPTLRDDVFDAFEKLHVDGLKRALDAASPGPVDVEFTVHHGGPPRRA